MEIFVRVQRGFQWAQAVADAIGAKFQFRAKRGWVMDGEIIHADIYSLVIQDWMTSATGLVEIGKWFHDSLESEYQRVGIERGPTVEDEARDRYLGSAVEMIRSGQPHKGVIFYNRFAAMANRTPISLVSLDPVMIDMGDCILELHGRNFFIASLASKTEH